MDKRLILLLPTFLAGTAWINRSTSLWPYPCEVAIGFGTYLFHRSTEPISSPLRAAFVTLWVCCATWAAGGGVFPLPSTTAFLYFEPVLSFLFEPDPTGLLNGGLALLLAQLLRRPGANGDESILHGALAIAIIYFPIIIPAQWLWGKVFWFRDLDIYHILYAGHSLAALLATTALLHRFQLWRARS